MARGTIAQQNFSGGELSPDLRGRFDLAAYYNGGATYRNFVATTQGVAKYRSGSVFAWNTKGNAAAILIPFEFNTEQAYILEFTDQIMRIFKDGGIVTETAQNITGITNANPAVVTCTAHGYSNGDSVVIQSVGGMIRVNNREFTVANVTANTFELSGIDTTSYNAYTSGGTVAKIVEVATPYVEADLFELNRAQTADTMYIVHPDYAPRKLTRTSHTAWTLATYTLSGNPFGTTKAASQAITGITRANPAVVTYGGADTYANGETVYISGVVGMAEVNGKNFTVANVDTVANTFELQDYDSTLNTAYSSGGTIEEYSAYSYPSVVTFFEQRLLFANSASHPQKIWASRAGSYDIFIYGTDATDAFAYTIASGKVNEIRWMAGTENFLAVGTAGAEFKASGGGQEDAITPLNISIKPVSYYGSHEIRPTTLDSHILFYQRDGNTLRSFEYDAVQDGYTSVNRTLTSDHALRSMYGKSEGAKQSAYQSGNTSINWVVRNDGVLAGLTFEPKEQVAGWHRHIAGGLLTGGKLSRPEYESVATIPQDHAPDQVWTVVKRTVGGATVRHVEYFADQPNIPQRMDYYTGAANKAADKAAYLQDMFEAQKRLWYVDSGIVYDGTVAQTMTLSAVTGSGVTATAGGSTFAATDVGREIWGKAGGRATITAYTSATVVTVDVTVTFPSVSIAASDWYLTTNTLTGAYHLIDEDVVALADGAVLDDITIDSDGIIVLPAQKSYVILGLSYLGIYQSMPLESGAEDGSGASGVKSVSKIGVRFGNTLGAKLGTDPYNLERVNFASSDDIIGRPPPLFTGVKLENVPDSTELEKYIYCIQDRPLPCNVQFFVPHITTQNG